jgi:hypothetical protein
MYVFSRSAAFALSLMFLATVVADEVATEKQPTEHLVSTAKPSILPERVTFNAHIRPIMSNTCFACHGPDEEENESEFRIDSFETATGTLPSDDDMRGIVPGSLEASEVYNRIMGLGYGEQMPPEEFRHHLTSYEKALFARWIEQGAEYEQHWAYAPVIQPEVPAVPQHRNKVDNPIDAFILNRLTTEGIEPSPGADKATLLRRVSLDLIGLPPTREELQAFLDDTSENSYEAVVRRLLSSPHFGERMASSWLDIVRFADTVGFHGDQNMRNFPYRDYVIDSFNQNKPFDEFTRQQIAGDLKPNPTPEDLVATGLLRLNMVTREGGAQPGEYLAKYKADRVRMIGTAWLGSTLACCECHNHKYDPFSAKDFYSLGAFFDDIRQWGVYSDYGYTPNKDLRGFNNDYPFPPEMRVQSESLRAEIQTLARERDFALLHSLGTDRLQSDEFAAWQSSVNGTLDKHPTGWVPFSVNTVNASATTKSEVLSDGSVLLTGKPTNDETISFTASPVHPTLINSVRLEVLPDERNGGFVGRADDGRFELSLAAAIKKKVVAKPTVRLNRPRYVRIELTGKQVLSLAEVQVFSHSKDADGKPANLALKGTATHSSDYKTAVASLAIDGITEGDYYKANSVTHTSLDGVDAWWEVDLGAEQHVDSIVVWGRTDGNYAERLRGFRLVLLDENRNTLQTESPATPKPSTTVAIPNEAPNQIAIAWGEADREDPYRFRSGAPPRTLGQKWRSGPSRWQLPSNENQLKHTAVYHFEKPFELADDEQLVIKLTSGNVGRVRLSVTPLGHAIAGWNAVSPELASALQKPSDTRSEEDQATLVSAHHLSTQSVRSQNRDAIAYRDRISDLHSGMAMTLVAQSVPADQIPVSRVRPRGNWQDESGELAPPAVPHFLPQLEIDSERRLNRTDLAAWLTSPQNPLVPRHFVNRTWRHLFGTGLSSKLDDLGSQGEWPSHPMLLDWLASEFVQSGWDVKQLVQKMVMSHTYRQAVTRRSELMEIDPYNRLLAQASPRRLEAEAIRDNALAISGLLNADYIGGPSAYPYQPSGHYKNIQFPSRRYTSSSDYRQYRRGVYMHWQRTFLHPMLVNFDAPSRDECTADRSPSNSPQQALTLLNDPSFVEASHAFASRLLSEGSDFETILDAAFEHALSRRPHSDEVESLRGLYERQLAYYREHPDEAEAFLSIGNTPTEAPNSVELAAWSQLCRVILNLHETITRY